MIRNNCQKNYQKKDVRKIYQRKIKKKMEKIWSEKSLRKY